jgi:hypothetical protein
VTAVTAYRLYKLRDKDRIAGPSTMVECDSDPEVISKAKAMLDGLDIEIWGSPLIGRPPRRIRFGCRFG